jgi:hypothetical protein
VTSAANDPAFFYGGPAGGYCTRDCEGDIDCGGGACLPGGEGSKCLLRCERGKPPLMAVDDALDPIKCHGRPDLACKAVGGAEACVPTCGSDEQCAGRACDPKTSVCVDEPSTGLPVNAPCDPADDQCAGKCIAIVEPYAFCSQPCAMGGDIARSFDCGGIDAGLCLYSVSNTGVGDDAYCTGSCQTHEDCQQPDVLFCFDFLSAGTNGKGYCIDVVAECTTPGASCTGPNDWPSSICTKTANGKLKCLDPTYPAPVLGTGGQGGAGGAAAGGAGGMGGAGGVGVGGAGGMGGGGAGGGN